MGDVKKAFVPAVEARANWPGSLAAFAVTERGLKIAGRLKKIYPSLKVVRPWEIKRAGVFKAVKRSFGSFDGLIFIGASGIAVRAVAPLLKGKDLDPAVVVIDEAGRFVVSLLSGHLGGANALTEEIASIVKATPVITTATDAAGLPCVEDIAKRFSLAVDDVKKIKIVNSAILKGVPVVIVDGNRKRLKGIREFLAPFNKDNSGAFVLSSVFKPRKSAGAYIVVTSKLTPGVPKRYAQMTMLLRPKDFVAGVGCRRGVGERALGQAVKEVFIEAGLSPLSLLRLATIDIKMDEAAITRLGVRAGVVVEYFSAGELNAVRPPSGPSSAALKATGAAGVSEPAAILSSGAKRLWVKKVKKGNVTVALAKAPYTS